MHGLLVRMQKGHFPFKGGDRKMEMLNATIAVLVFAGALLGALKKVLQEWSEIRRLLSELIFAGKRKKDGSHRRKR
jgi:hypothetical protein